MDKEMKEIIQEVEYQGQGDKHPFEKSLFEYNSQRFVDIPYPEVSILGIDDIFDQEVYWSVRLLIIRQK